MHLRGERKEVRESRAKLTLITVNSLSKAHMISILKGEFLGARKDPEGLDSQNKFLLIYFNCLFYFC